MVTSAYLAQRILHENILVHLKSSIESLFGSWKKYKKIEPFAMSWPLEILRTEDGKKIDGPILLRLSDEKEEHWRGLILELIRRTDAFAVLLAEQKDDEVRVTFESQCGSKCWRLPIAQSGDVRILRQPKVSEDKEYLGYLWKPATPRA